MLGVLPAPDGRAGIVAVAFGEASLVGGGERPARDQLEPEASRVEGTEAVDGAQKVRIELGDGTVVDLFDEDLIGQLPAAGCHLPAAQELVGLVGDGLEAPAVAVDGVAEGREVERHGLDAALEHERPRHARVVLEVAVEEPVVRADLAHALEIPSPPGAALGIELGDLVDEEHAPRLDLRRAGVGLGAIEGGAEAAPGFAG